MRGRAIICGTVAAVLMAGPALAQKGSLAAPQPKPEEIEKKRDAAAVEQQYRRALQNATPSSKPASNDPWENMRGANDAKAKK